MTTPSAQFFTIISSGITWHAFLLTLQPVIPILIAVSPLILLLCLFIIFWDVWIKYVRAEFFYKEKTLLLEILLPKETVKSPAAMELFLTALHQTGGEAGAYDVYWMGKTRAWYSLELVSIEGQVHFYIWTRASQKNFIESSLYAQFPGIEVHEVDDYAKAVHFDPEKMGMWGCEFKFAKGNAYPIKTYVDYGLDKDPKEEYKVDPLAPMLEYLGSIGPNQQVWIQFIVRAHKDDQKKAGKWLETTDLWKEEAATEVHKILGRNPKTRMSEGNDDEDSGGMVRLSPGETDIVKAIERGVSKLAFDVGIRGIYMATNKDNFVGTNIPGMFGSFKQFNAEHLNGFKLKIGVWSTAFGDPWLDFRRIRENRMLNVLLETYKRRMYFYPPYRYVNSKNGKPLVMNTEELATVFHFPGQVAATPTLARIPSKKSQAPANLPI